MSTRDAALAASRLEVQALRQQPISEVTPSRRDFAMYVDTQKQDLAVIARLRLRVGWGSTQLVDYARACDDADVAALALTTGEQGIVPEDLRAVAAATSAPILRENLVLEPVQLFYSRLHGADAAIFPAGAFDASTLYELVMTARSLHMASVIEVANNAEVVAAAAIPFVIIGVHCQQPDGALDIEGMCALAQQVPKRCPVIALAEVRSPNDYVALRGVCDAVCVTLEGDVAAAVSEIRGT
jgi:indole-3-glycerol phosphate synthase